MTVRGLGSSLVEAEVPAYGLSVRYFSDCLPRGAHGAQGLEEECGGT
jgi:hypothetical protein